MATTETQTDLSGNLILDDPETKDAEVQAEDDDDHVWMLSAGTQTSDEGVFFVDAAPVPSEDERRLLDDPQQAALICYGHAVEPLPYAAGGGGGCLGVGCWDDETLSLSDAFQALLQIKRVDPWKALTILACAGKVLHVVVPHLKDKWPLKLLQGAVLMMTLNWEYDGGEFSKDEQIRFCTKLGLYGNGRHRAIQWVQSHCAEVLGRS